MGILVPEATLPSGFTLSNVYMSFSHEPVYISPMGPSRCQIYSYYKVWADVEKSKPSDIRILLTVQGADSSLSAYTVLYDALKEQYPGSEDVSNPEPPPPLQELIPSSELMSSNVVSEPELLTSNVVSEPELLTSNVISQ
jgi:hypothetical protein